MNLDSPKISTLLRIMWTKSNIASFGHNHFVSLVEVDDNACCGCELDSDWI